MGLTRPALSDPTDALEHSSRAELDATDAELMAGIGRGEPRSPEELIRRYWKPVVCYAAAIVDADTAEDIAQETFEVARNDDRRFVVRTRAGDAVVLGTRFDVRVGEDGMQVFVVEGRVAHQAAGQEVQVRAMELSRVTHGRAPEVEPIEDAEPLLSWLGEFLVFQSTPIKDVAHESE